MDDYHLVDDTGAGGGGPAAVAAEPDRSGPLPEPAGGQDSTPVGRQNAGGALRGALVHVVQSAKDRP